MKRHKQVAMAGLLALSGWQAAANQAEQDALALEARPVDAAPTANPGRMSLELAVGGLQRAAGDSTVGAWRTTLDWTYGGKLSPQTRFTVSNRTDAFEPEDAGGKTVVNSLREAYLSWGSTDGSWAVDAGRVHLKLGPAIGYNPTDYFRGASLRTMPTADPAALREMRQGSVMLRLQRLSSAGSLSLVLSPKLADTPGSSSFSLDLGSTNPAHRVLLSASSKWSDRLSTQLHLYKRDGEPAQLGLSASALASNASVLYAEWAGSRESSAADRLVGVSTARRSGHRASAGWTYTTGDKLSLTVEAQANSHGLSRGEWDRLTLHAPWLMPVYFGGALRQQDLAPRKAVLVYGSQRDLGGQKNLTLTGFVQSNLQDKSRLYWLELRRQWSSWELAAQLQRTTGVSGSEFSVLQRRQWAQVLTTFRF